jgi:hypothetical protein
MSDAKTSEVPNLVRRLGSRRVSSVDAARARLSVIGGRAVEALVDALEDADSRVRARVMPLLALIQDPRGRAPLIAMLLDRNPRLRAVAAQCLGRFACADAVAALGRMLRRERCVSVREAAARALVEQFAAGQEQALSSLLQILRDLHEAPRTKIAALAVARLLPAAERRALLTRLRRDADPDVRRMGEDLGEPTRGEGAVDTPRLLADLASPDYATWNRAVYLLAAQGVCEPLLAAMRRHACDPEYCTRAGIALKAMGPRRCRELGDAILEVEEPVPLQILVDVVGALGEKSLIYRMKDLIDRLAQRPLVARPGVLDSSARIRAKAHLELARVGSRVAIQDLHEALAAVEGRIELELLSALRLIGQRDDIATLLRAYPAQDDFTRQQIADAVLAIMRRERIRRNNRIFHALSAAQREALAQILPPRARRSLARGSALPRSETP